MDTLHHAGRLGQGLTDLLFQAAETTVVLPARPLPIAMEME